jgi:hypothetical protein
VKKKGLGFESWNQIKQGIEIQMSAKNKKTFLHEFKICKS